MIIFTPRNSKIESVNQRASIVSGFRSSNAMLRSMTCPQSWYFPGPKRSRCAKLILQGIVHGLSRVHYLETTVPKSYAMIVCFYQWRRRTWATNFHSIGPLISRACALWEVRHKAVLFSFGKSYPNELTTKIFRYHLSLRRVRVWKAIPGKI